VRGTEPAEDRMSPTSLIYRDKVEIDPVLLADSIDFEVTPIIEEEEEGKEENNLNFSFTETP
jgi:hypothetical protein